MTKAEMVKMVAEVAGVTQAASDKAITERPRCLRRSLPVP